MEETGQLHKMALRSIPNSNSAQCGAGQGTESLSMVVFFPLLTFYASGVVLSLILLIGEFLVKHLISRFTTTNNKIPDVIIKEPVMETKEDQLRGMILN